MTQDEFDQACHQFSGSPTLTRVNQFTQAYATEGVIWMAETCKCYWFLDIICSVQFKHMPFQSWKLIVNGSKADAICEDGNGNVLYRQHIPYTDCEVNLKVFATYENGKTIILLPQEY